MPQPNITTVRGPIQTISIAYRNLSYIGDRVFPIVDGVPARALIYEYLKGAWFRDEAGLRGPGSRANRGGYPTTTHNVTLDEYAFAREVTDEERQEVREAAGPPLRPDEDAVLFSTDKIDLKKERLVASAILTGTWSGTATGEDKQGLWAAGANNTFIADVETRIETIRGNTGVRPNVLMLSANTLKEIKQESSVLDRIKYTERGIVSAPLIAALFDLDEVLIGDAIYSSANEAAAGTDFTAVNVWETNAGKGAAFLFYRPSRPGLKVPLVGVQARGVYEDGRPRRVTKWREEAEHQDVYEVAEKTDIVVTGGYLGYLWKDTIAT